MINNEKHIQILLIFIKLKPVKSANYETANSLR